MELYTQTALEMSALLTQRYSTSFSMASRLFDATIKPHIYAIYGLVRVADEIVDTYSGDDRRELLDALEAEVLAAMQRGFSVNPVVHAFATTARRYEIPAALIEPFFTSMRFDIDKKTYDSDEYKTYIYGSAEVVGLYCLHVFCDHDDRLYKKLEIGARHLGAAYQKVNFLRDIASDYKQLGRFYFPNSSFETFDDAAKAIVVADIQADFRAAEPAITGLPGNARAAVRASYRYYRLLLEKLASAPAEDIKQHRLRIPAHRKMLVLAATAVKDRR